MPRLEGKNAIVTGAGRGIGKAIAETFLREGARVLLCDLHQDRTDAALSELRGHGPVDALTGNVADPGFCAAVTARAQERFGALDVLVNNAGTARSRPFLEHTEADWDHTLDVNLKSMFLLGRLAAKIMVEQRTGGVILNMASTNSYVGEKDLTAYNVSKAGVLQLTRTMAVELGPHGIRVNCVSPGFILTDLAREAGVDDEVIANYTDKIPLKRYGTPTDVANLYAFLASDEASFITGTSIIIDGGQLALG